MYPCTTAHCSALTCRLATDSNLQPLRFMASVAVGAAVVVLLHRNQQARAGRLSRKAAKDEDSVPARNGDPDWQVVSASDR